TREAEKKEARDYQRSPRVRESRPHGVEDLGGMVVGALADPATPALVLAKSFPGPSRAVQWELALEARAPVEFPSETSGPPRGSANSAAPGRGPVNQEYDGREQCRIPSLTSWPDCTVGKTPRPGNSSGASPINSLPSPSGTSMSGCGTRWIPKTSSSRRTRV